MRVRRTICFVFAIVTVAAFAMLFLSLFDIMPLNSEWHNILGATAVVALALFLKTYIHLYRYTSKD